MNKTKTEIPRAYTSDELRNRFQKHMFMLCDYWSKVPHREGNETEYDRMTGLCHSIQAYLDGRTLNSPGIDLVVRSHETDKEFYISHGENWYEDGTLINDCSLTETFYSCEPKK